MLRFCAVILLMIFGMGAAYAETVDPNWPDRPIRFVVPFPAGAISDLVAGKRHGRAPGRLPQHVLEARCDLRLDVPVPVADE